MNETLFYVRSVAVLIIASCFSDKSRTTKKRFVVVATNAKFTIIDIAVSKNAMDGVTFDESRISLLSSHKSLKIFS